MSDVTFQQAEDIVLFANGDVSLRTSVSSFFLVITSFGFPMGKVFINETAKLCQYSRDGLVFGMQKESAVCAINTKDFSRAGRNNVTLQTEDFTRTVRIVFNENPEGRIVMEDGDKGTDWKGCREDLEWRSGQMENNKTDLQYHAWKYSICPQTACKDPSLSVEVVSCDNLWRAKDMSNIGYNVKIYNPEAKRNSKTKYKAHDGPSQLVEALTSGDFDESTKNILADMAKDISLPCRMRKNLVGNVVETDRMSFYFFTPEGRRITQSSTLLKYELSGVNLKIFHVDEEEAGIYYCVLELNSSVIYGSSFLVRIKTCFDTGCNGTDVCTKLDRLYSIDYTCIPIGYFESDTFTRGYISPLWLRILFWSVLCIALSANITANFFFVADRLKIEDKSTSGHKEATRKK